MRAERGQLRAVLPVERTTGSAARGGASRHGWGRECAGAGARMRMGAMPPSNFLSGMNEFPNQSTVTSLSFHGKTRLHQRGVDGSGGGNNQQAEGGGHGNENGGEQGD